MARYLISFPSAAMVVPVGELEAMRRDAHGVIEEATAAGVYLFGGGIDEDVPPVLVSAEGTVAEDDDPWAPPLDGGFTVLEQPSQVNVSFGEMERGECKLRIYTSNARMARHYKL